MKIVKSERRTHLHVDTLSDLLDVKVEGPSLANLNTDHAISLWWSDCKTVRRVNQRPRKEYRARATVSTDSDSGTSEPQEETLTLEDWDEWFEFHVDDLDTDTVEPD